MSLRATITAEVSSRRCGSARRQHYRFYVNPLPPRCILLVQQDVDEVSSPARWEAHKLRQSLQQGHHKKNINRRLIRNPATTKIVLV